MLIDQGPSGFWESDSGPAVIYREPEEGVPYVVGGDTAGEGSDYSVGQVVDNVTGGAGVHPAGQDGRGRFCQTALLPGALLQRGAASVEANFSSYPIRELERLRYLRQFVRQAEDSYTHRLRDAYGFRTTAVTRPVAIAGLVEVVGASGMAQRQRHPGGNADLCPQREGQGRGSGGRSRRLCDGAGHRLLQQGAAERVPEKGERTVDPRHAGGLQNASPEEKRMLRKRWGEDLLT